MNNEYGSGDSVIISDTGQTYNSYRSMAEKLRATKWRYMKSPSTGIEGKVVDCALHLSHKRRGMIYLVDCGEYEYLIGESGLRLK